MSTNEAKGLPESGQVAIATSLFASAMIAFISILRAEPDDATFFAAEKRTIEARQVRATNGDGLSPARTRGGSEAVTDCSKTMREHNSHESFPNRSRHSNGQCPEGCHEPPATEPRDASTR